MQHVDDIRRWVVPLRNRAGADFVFRQRATNVENLCNNILKEPDRPDRPELEAELNV